MVDIPVTAVYAKSVHPSDSPRYFRIRPSETPTYRPSPAGSKATLRTSVSSEVNHLHGQENVKRTGDFRQCEDAITACWNSFFDKVVWTIFRRVFRRRRLSERLKFGHDVIVTINTMS
ncbi:hypothetical protein IGI04_014374 [Brassica rapa subsp. trilocularis]|uniref:Uncharacterized protein n=1 Tax=Brassica rapa subsp. trilocularis TaxID=1813537 RepID=A0ABQ7MM07_BRACM|nr:hypothetical protein IGI04_014374 [Brassica rapa subsp. trilocularis]